MFPSAQDVFDWSSNLIKLVLQVDFKCKNNDVMDVSANNNNMPLPPYLHSLDFTCKKHDCIKLR